MIQFEGITWNHTRGFVPKVAAAQRYAELHRDVDIRWSKRSLLEFGEFPVEKLADRFDLLIIDHPYIGFGAENGVFLPLNDLLPAGTLDDLAVNSVGPSHASYQWHGKQWALAVDAACPVAHWRPDLLAQEQIPIPKTWEEVNELIRRKKVLAPLIHTDAIHLFYMFCHALGETPFAQEERLISSEVGLAALEQCRELVKSLPAACLAMNPINVLEAMSSDNDWWYCPFAFGYSNYARPNYACHVLHGGTPVRWKGAPLKTTLGGTGIAISKKCNHPQVAADFVAFLASGSIQSTLYFDSGGQPAHRSAWLDSRINLATHDYFRRTLPALDQAWLRPRYSGYLHFQDHAAFAVAACLKGEISPHMALSKMDSLFHESRKAQ